MKSMAITRGDGTVTPELVAQVLRAGFDHVLLREPTLTDLLGFLQPGVIVHAKTPAPVPPDWPRHFPQGMAPEGMLFGVSCHSPAELDAAFQAGASYALLSPVWAPNSKVDTRAPLGPARFLRWAAGRNVWALGGITPARRHQLAGAAGYAVLGGVFAQRDPASAARAYHS